MVRFKTRMPGLEAGHIAGVNLAEGQLVVRATGFCQFRVVGRSAQDRVDRAQVQVQVQVQHTHRTVYCFKALSVQCIQNTLLTIEMAVDADS